MTTGFSLDVRYYRLSEALQPYFTALYAYSFTSEGGRVVEDFLHPEWSVMRFSQDVGPLGCLGAGPLVRQPAFVASGPTSKPTHFGLTTTRIWGLGLQPAGWAKFVCGKASDLADSLMDGMTHQAFVLFRPILGFVKNRAAAPLEIEQAINNYLMQHVDRPIPHSEQVFALHTALRDPDIATVRDLEEQIGISTRSLERLCASYFGFPPKLLLRRQRFLRSLAQFMLTRGTSWTDAIDGQYFDQAQFVKDFRAFMEMTPSEYAASPHPVLESIIAQRMADQGAAPQTDLPTILRYVTPPAK